MQAGAEIVEGNSVWQSEIILKVNAPLDDEIALLNPGTTLVSFIWPAQNPELMQKLAERNVTVMADGFCAAYLTRTIAGRTKLDGEHRRLSRHC
ncbi:NAD(P) transhydrogenase subunit alpha [Escherichia coli]|nr:NAD(P) transhydrogenase subunit alpha [Escherichia coli]